MQTMINKMNPIEKKERMVIIDIIRGFALLGVLLVNMLTFNSTFLLELTSSSPLTAPLLVEGTMNKIIALLVQVFAEGKFYTIFSVLFGLGFYIFISRVEAKGYSPNKLFIKRLFFLLIFGLLHMLLVWYGDILHVYSITGVFLLFFRNCQSKTIKKWIIALLFIAILLTVGVSLVDEFTPFMMSEVAYTSYINSMDAAANTSIEIYQHASYSEAVQYRVSNEWSYRLMGLVFQVPKILAMFLIGLLIGKEKIVENLSDYKRLNNKVWKVSGIVGGCASLSYLLIQQGLVTSSQLLSLGLIVTFEEVSTVAISLFYISSFVKLFSKASTKRIIEPFNYIGRMALTNYLMQCIICSFIFYGHGLGLVTSLSLLACVAITVLLFGIQIIMSKSWLARYNYGPFEWVWRRLTYGKLL